MKVLVTGYCGGIGGAIFRRLSDANEVVGMERWSQVAYGPDYQGVVIAHGLIDCEDDSAAAWEDNYHSAVRIAQSFERQAPAGARLVAITSNSAVIPRSPTPTYCAAKAALELYVSSLHRRLIRTGRYAFTIQPGLIETSAAMTRLRALGEGPYEEQMRRLPYGGPAAVEDVAEWVHWLLTSRAAPLGSGHPIRLDAGEH